MRTVAAGVVLLVAAVSGCSSGDAPPAEVAPLASGTATASATASPGRESLQPTAPVSRASTASLAREEPRDFVVRYLDELSHAFQTLDPSGLEALSDPGCGGCNNLISAVEQAARAGERTRGGDFHLLFSAAPAPERGETIVEFRYTRDAAVLVDRSGEAVAELSADPPLNAQMRLLAVDSSWLVLGFRAIAE